MKRNPVTPYRGPVTAITVAETARVLALLDGRGPNTEPGDDALRAKLQRTLSSDPKWRTPTT